MISKLVEKMVIALASKIVGALSGLIVKWINDYLHKKEMDRLKESEIKMEQARSKDEYIDALKDIYNNLPGAK